MAEGARLESVYTLTRIEGSNPSLTAKIHSHVVLWNTRRLKSQGFKLFLCFVESCHILSNPPQIGGQLGDKLVILFFVPQFVRIQLKCLPMLKLEK